MPLQPALLGGAFIGVLSALPLIQFGNCCCCMWVIAGGMLAAYADQAPGRTGNLARGALDGLLAGVVGAFVFLMVSTVVGAVLAPVQQRLVEQLLAGGYDMPPEVRGLFEMMRDREEGLLDLFIGFLFHLIVGVIFATLGGLLGALFFWRDNVAPALGGQPPPPPIPPEL